MIQFFDKLKSIFGNLATEKLAYFYNYLHYDRDAQERFCKAMAKEDFLRMVSKLNHFEFEGGAATRVYNSWK
jgi:hypothetical protein